MLTNFAVVLMLAVLGVAFSRGKGAFLIAGYNTMPREEKARYDREKLCRFMGKLMFVLSGCWLVVAIAALADLRKLVRAGQVLFAGACVVGVILANTGARLKK